MQDITEYKSTDSTLPPLLMLNPQIVQLLIIIPSSYYTTERKDYTCATYVHAGAEIQEDQPGQAGESGHEAGVGERAGAQLKPLQARMPRRQPVEAAVLHPGALVEAQLAQVGRCDAALKRPRGHGGEAEVQTEKAVQQPEAGEAVRRGVGVILRLGTAAAADSSSVREQEIVGQVEVCETSHT